MDIKHAIQPHSAAVALTVKHKHGIRVALTLKEIHLQIENITTLTQDPYKNNHGSIL